jgi:P-type Cu+ transporter
MASYSVAEKNRVHPADAVLCYHCQDVCPQGQSTPYRVADKPFCCEGCKTVFEILNTHDMCAFYATGDRPVIPKNLRPTAAIKNYAYLDDAEIQERLIEFRNGPVAQVTFYIPQMHCVSCIWLLENMTKLDGGVTHSKANFLKKTVTVQFNTEETSMRRLVAMLHTIGYAPELNLSDVENGAKPAINRRLAYQIGVAGFAFGNVMLFSFPEYVGMSRELDPWFAGVFGWLSIAIALPVLLYSARDYFVSAWRGLTQGHLNIDVPLCLAYVSLFGRSVWEIATHTGAGYLDSFTGLVLLMLTGKWFQQRIWNELSFERDFKSYFPIAATVRTGDAETTAPVSRLVPGDIIVVRSQEIIPADGILLKGEALIDYSFVTGESDPVRVLTGEKIFAGGRQTGASVEISLTRRVAQSHLTKLWNNEAFKPQAKGQVTRLADAAGHYFTWLILAFGGASVAYWWGVRGDVATAINAFTAVMIVACPCNIALSIPFTLGNIVRLMGRNGFYLKNIGVVESLADIDTVVLDKTGTITTTADAGQWMMQGGAWTPSEQMAIRSLVRQSTHPLSRKVFDTLPETPTQTPDDFTEIPGHGISGRVNGHFLKIGAADFVTSGEKDRDFLQQAGEASGVYVAVDGRLRGFFEIKTRMRPNAAAVLAFFRQLPARIFLLSGDTPRAAQALSTLFPVASAMHFRQSPQDKLNFVKNCQQEGQKVMMIGDGLNDAGALRQSDAGIVIAENVNNFTPACDAILAATAFARLPQLLQLAQRGVQVVHYSYAVAFTYNAIGLSFAVTGSLSPLVAAVLMPVSSVSIVLFGVGMSNLAAKRVLKY